MSMKVQAGQRHMRLRSLLGCVLLTLAALAFIEVVVDAAAYQMSVRQQWRTAHQSPVRVSPRKTPAILAEAPKPPVLTVLGPVVVRDPSELSPPLPPSVFVPPRV